MVKMPSFDDIKKAGAGLMDQAKSSMKSAGIVPVKKDGTSAAQDDDAVKSQFQVLYASLAELTQLQAAQAAQAKKIEAQIAQLSKAIAASQAAVATVSPTTVVAETQTEEKKDL